MTGIFAFYKNNFKFFQKNSFTSQKFYYLCSQIATMLHQKTNIMTNQEITILKEVQLLNYNVNGKKVWETALMNGEKWLTQHPIERAIKFCEIYGINYLDIRLF